MLAPCSVWVVSLTEGKFLEIFPSSRGKIILKWERGTGCEGDVNKKVSLCLFVFYYGYVSVSSPVVLCEHGWSKNNGVRFLFFHKSLCKLT